MILSIVIEFRAESAATKPASESQKNVRISRAAGFAWLS
jgi:hypothetical protein